MTIFFNQIERFKRSFFRQLTAFHEFVKADQNVVKLKFKTEENFPFIKNKFYHLFYSVSGIFIAWLLLYTCFWSPPIAFREHTIVSIPKGSHLSEISQKMKDENVIISPFWLKVFIILNGGEKNVIAGDYYFPEKVGVIAVADKIIHGKFGFTPTRVVIFEGLNSYEIGESIGTLVPNFDKDGFVSKAKDFEGYLFPDTYFLTSSSKPEDVISLMRENFARKTENLLPDAEKLGKPFDDIIKVASIVEDEASSLEDKRIVAGIIWKRLKLDMPLQVDSTLKYVSGKASHEITKDELEDEDNPYNTYANKGLPPTPISNPGLDSIRAAIAPTNTSYLYFLSSKNGTIHYAETFEQHKRNRELYLGR